MPGIGEILRKSKKTEAKAVAVKGAAGKTYLKAMLLRDLSNLDEVKNEVKSGNIMILRITPLANKSIDDVKRAINELCEFVESLGGDIARLGEERVVVCPPNVRIWREKTQVSNEPIPTAA
ncbi:MAG: cell division protein SepF [Candidatus Bathyarchaeia archaeon]